MIMPKRKWKPINGYEGLYEISNLGEIKSYRKSKPKILKNIKDSNGYLVITLCKDNNKERKFIHRIVAEHFIPNPYKYNEVNHKDENPSNPLYTNLEWCTHKYNINYGTCKERISKSSIGRKRSKRSIDKQIERQQKKVYCIELHKEFNSIKEASEFLGISDTSLSKHLKCIYKTCGGYHWKYL